MNGNATSRRRGFTLIELLVVLAIIATLLTLVGPRYMNHMEMAKVTVLRQDLATLRDAIDKYAGDKGHYPDSLEDLVGSGYIRKIPEDPITGSSSSWVTKESTDTDKPGIADVNSGANGSGPDGTAYQSW